MSDRYPRETAQRKLALYDEENARIWRWTIGAAIALAGVVTGALLVFAQLALRHTLVAVLAIALLASSGCHTVSDTAVNETRTAASSAEGTLKDWGALTDDQKKESVWKLARAARSVLASSIGDAMPEMYASNPWEAVTRDNVAPVQTSR